MPEPATDHRPFVKRSYWVRQDVGSSGNQNGNRLTRMDERPAAWCGVVAGHDNEQVRLIGDLLYDRTERGIERLNGSHFANWVFVMPSHIRGLGVHMHELIPLGKEGICRPQFSL